MVTKSRRDAAFRDQPGLFDERPDPAARPAAMPFDQGKVSRNRTYDAVQPRHKESAELWLRRIESAGSAGVTLDQLSEDSGVPVNFFSGRITELANARKVVRTGERRQTRSGRTAAVIVAAKYFPAENN